MRVTNKDNLPSWDEIKKQLPDLPRAVRLVWSYSRGWMVL